MRDQQNEPAWGDELTQLIQHGRDREAAVLAADRLQRSTQGVPMDPCTQLDTVLPMLNDP